jgi:hypothetical protein
MSKDHPWRERIKVRVCLIINAVYMEIPPWFIQRPGNPPEAI